MGQSLSEIIKRLKTHEIHLILMFEDFDKQPDETCISYLIVWAECIERVVSQFSIYNAT